jgi:hypothetical protein
MSEAPDPSAPGAPEEPRVRRADRRRPPSRSTTGGGHGLSAAILDDQGRRHRSGAPTPEVAMTGRRRPPVARRRLG